MNEHGMTPLTAPTTERDKSEDGHNRKVVGKHCVQNLGVGKEGDCHGEATSWSACQETP
jgi:hypothetical protein